MCKASTKNEIFLIVYMQRANGDEHPFPWISYIQYVRYNIITVVNGFSHKNYVIRVFINN